MNKVVYLLGAGFSAPLGLPVMSNFLERSKDMYFSDPEKLAHFQHVFDTINRMSVCKNIYNADLYNIEEILSILEMSERVGNRNDEQTFIKYIVDVINENTPDIESIVRDKIREFWSARELSCIYARFVGSLFNLELQNNGHWGNCGQAEPMDTEQIRNHYSVVSLNYDLVLELCLRAITTFYKPLNGCGEFLRTPTESEAYYDSVPLAKLHGSVDSGNIVPPTWNKSLQSNIQEQWQLAHRCLKETNHVRIIGYSLPITDAYIKFLLKSAVIDNPHLKTLHVICRDPSGVVRARFDSFMADTFPGYKFIDGSVEDYLKGVVPENGVVGGVTRLTMLEKAHQGFCEKR